MDIFRSETRPDGTGSPDYFTGAVRTEAVVDAPAPARVRALKVTFEPGARTNWHTHPLGQTLYVMSGIGLIQKDGEAVQDIRPGDTVWIAPGERHWHGARPDHHMCHIAMHENLDGSNVDWAEPVSDADYAG